MTIDSLPTAAPLAGTTVGRRQARMDPAIMAETLRGDVGAAAENAGLIPRLLQHFHAMSGSLGGQVLTIGCMTPREVVILVPNEAPAGTQELIVTVAGRVVQNALVQVQ